MSTQHLLEALETTVVTRGPKERPFSMVTPRSFGREVLLRRVPSSCNEGLLRVVCEEGNLALACVEGKLAAPFFHVGPDCGGLLAVARFKVICTETASSANDKVNTTLQR